MPLQHRLRRARIEATGDVTDFAFPHSPHDACEPLGAALAGLMVEPVGAVALAGLLRHTDDCRGTEVAAIVCGGNVTAAQRRSWLA